MRRRVLYPVLVGLLAAAVMAGAAGAQTPPLESAVPGWSPGSSPDSDAPYGPQDGWGPYSAPMPNWWDYPWAWEQPNNSPYYGWGYQGDPYAAPYGWENNPYYYWGSPGTYGWGDFYGSPYDWAQRYGQPYGYPYGWDNQNPWAPPQRNAPGRVAPGEKNGGPESPEGDTPMLPPMWRQPDQQSG